MQDQYDENEFRLRKLVYDKATAAGYADKILDEEARKRFIERGQEDYQGADKYLVEFEEVGKLNEQLELE